MPKFNELKKSIDIDSFSRQMNDQKYQKKTSLQVIHQNITVIQTFYPGFYFLSFN